MRKRAIAFLVALVGVLLLGGATHAAGPGQARARLRLAAETLEMTPREVARALRAGETLAELAEARGLPLETLQAALIEPEAQRLARLVEAGVYNQVQADYLLAQAEVRLNAYLTLPPRQARQQPELAALGELLGLSQAEILAALRAGQRPTELIQAQGQSVETVVAALVARREAALTERVALDLMTESQKRLALYRYERGWRARLSR